MRAWRQTYGLSQSELARHLGVESVTISRWERGVRKRGAPEGMLELALAELGRRLDAQRREAETVEAST